MDPDSGGPDRPLPIEELLNRANASLVYELIMHPKSGSPRKLAIEPGADGQSWVMREYEFNGCKWRQLGSEQLASFSSKTSIED